METLHEMAKRCAGGQCGISCSGCPAYVWSERVCLIQTLSQMPDAGLQIDKLRAWATSHPRKTYKDIFVEKFPNSEIKEDVTNLCRARIFGENIHKMCDNYLSCEMCWNDTYVESE